MAWPGIPTTSGKLSKTAMLSRIMATSAGSSNCARKASRERVVVRVARAARLSNTITRRPAREAKKAVAVPTRPPPTTTAWAVAGSSAAEGVVMGDPTRLICLPAAPGYQRSDLALPLPEAHAMKGEVVLHGILGIQAPEPAGDVGRHGPAR